MQSWGTQSRFSVRDTQLEPSKSGVIGLLCAAQEQPRDNLNHIQELARYLWMGVRIDCEGRKEYDYHTARNILSSDETTSQRSVVGNRYYLADACFLVGLGSDNLTLLQDLDRALADPAWPLFLGRKSFVPSAPVRLKDGLREGIDLLDALRNYAWLGRAWQKRPERLRFVIEHREGDPTSPDQPITQVNDQPLSFDILNRHYTPRRVRTIIEPPRKKIFQHFAKVKDVELETGLEAVIGG
jgi:CRISPR system Cascade subunit CasD